ncbi:hypothetical protein IV102_13745 [bacterium]|nr:hypothetical protein [bacterium]
MQVPLYEVLQNALKGCGKEVKALLDEAWAAAQRGQTEQAVAVARKAVALGPQAAGPHLLLGLCLFRAGQMVQCAAELDPLCADTLAGVAAPLYAGRARVELAQASQPPDSKLLDEAYRLFQRAEELDARNGDIPFAMAQIHWLRREDLAALRCIEQAVRADGQLDYHDLDALEMGARIRMRLRNWPAFDDTARRIERACHEDMQRQQAARILHQLAGEAAREGGQLSALRAAYLAVQVCPGDQIIAQTWEGLSQSCSAELVAKVRAEQTGSATVRMSATKAPSSQPPELASSPTDSRSASYSAVVVAALVAVILFVFVGLGAVARYYFSKPRPFCGELTPAQGPGATACKNLLRSFGQKLLQRQKGKEEFPFQAEDIEDLPSCPLSDEAYGFLSSDDNKQAWLFCKGATHGSPNSPSFDLEKGEIVDGAIEPPKGSWARFQWLCWTDQESRYPEALEEASRRSDAAQVGSCRSLALRLMHRHEEALDTLLKSQTDKPTGAISCYNGLGRYDEALALARFHDEPATRIFFLKGDFRSALEEAAKNTGAIPDITFMWVSLAQGDHAENFRQANRFLEAAGCGSSDSVYAVAMLVISAIAEKDEKRLEVSRAVLKRALHESPRCWPFPLLQMVNGETTEAALEPACAPAQLMNLKLFAGLLLEAKGKGQEAHLRYQWLADHGDKNNFEYRVALQRLGL